MAEIVGSAVVGEAVNRLCSLISGDGSSQDSLEVKAERLEMAVLKLGSAVSISEDWHITQPPLLRWKGKLKRLAQEGDEILHAHKRQVLQCRDGNNFTITAITKHIIRTAESFMSSVHKDDALSDTTVQRFERLADGASSFIKFVESGGHPRRSSFFPSLTRSLLDGKSLEFSLRRENDDALILIWPWQNPREMNRLEACFMISYENDVIWEKNVNMVLWLHLVEAVDILGTIQSCLDLLPPQFRVACTSISQLVSQMLRQHTQYSIPSAKSFWYHRRLQSWNYFGCESSMWNGCSDVGLLRLPEPAIHFGVHCYASPLIDESTLHTHSVELACHMSRYLLSGMQNYEQVEPHELLGILPNVTNGFYYKVTQATEHGRQLRCSQSSTYLSVTPMLLQPLTLSKLYSMENSTALASSSRVKAAGKRCRHK